MKPRFERLWLVLLVWALAANLWAGGFRDQADRILQEGRLEKLVTHVDNLTGQIAWAKVFYMEALLNLYEITGDSTYLALFTRHARDLMAQENLAAGRVDDDGRLRRGWQCDGAYTFSLPVVLKDRTGQPALRLQGKRWGQNNTTRVEITHPAPDRITITVKNSATGYQQSFRDLTLSRLKQWAPSTHTMYSYVSVEVLGENLPGKDTVIVFQPAKVTLTTFHNPRILVPLLRYVHLVRRGAPGHHQALADSVWQFAREVFLGYDSLWQPAGYYINEPGIPFAYAGLPVPHNILADHGRCLLYFYRITSQAEFLRRMARISLRLFSAFKEQEDKLVFYYAFGDLFEGWEHSERYHYPSFPGARRMEDVSHFKSTILYVFETLRHDLAYFNGFRTRVQRIFDQVYQDGRWAYYVDGTGQIGVRDVAGTFVLMFPFQKDYQQKCLQSFQIYLKNTPPSVHTLLGLTHFLWLNLDPESAP